MKKTIIAKLEDEFEADIITELLMQNSIFAENKSEDNCFNIYVLEQDITKAKNIIKAYKKEDINQNNKPKNNGLKLLNMFLLIFGAVIFYYIMSLIFKLILQLF